MNVQLKRNKIQVAFSTIPTGTCFVCNGAAYLKCEEGHNAVRLIDGRIDLFSPGYLVEPRQLSVIEE